MLASESDTSAGAAQLRVCVATSPVVVVSERAEAVRKLLPRHGVGRLECLVILRVNCLAEAKSFGLALGVCKVSEG